MADFQPKGEFEYAEISNETNTSVHAQCWSSWRFSSRQRRIAMSFRKSNSLPIRFKKQQIQIAD